MVNALFYRTIIYVINLERHTGKETMIFEKIPTIRTSDELIDKAFRRGVRAATGKKSSGRASFLDSQESMLLTSANILSDNLANISKKFPNFDELSGFYYELADILVGVDKIRTSLSRVAWTSEKIHDLAREYVGRMRGSPTPENLRKQCFGRMGSLMDSINKRYGPGVIKSAAEVRGNITDGNNHEGCRFSAPEDPFHPKGDELMI